jgi:hypothetical protein
MKGFKQKRNMETQVGVLKVPSTCPEYEMAAVTGIRISDDCNVY